MPQQSVSRYRFVRDAPLGPDQMFTPEHDVTASFSPRCRCEVAPWTGKMVASLMAGKLERALFSRKRIGQKV